MQAMFEAEVTAVAGVKGKHDPARTVDGHEVPLRSYRHFAGDDLLSEVVLERMLAGVATRRHARIAEPVGKALTEAATSTGRSAVSRRFVKETETALAELLARDLTGKQIKVLMLDGEHMAGRCVIVALAITAGGEKFPVGLWDGATENKTVVKAMLADLVSRAVRPGRAAGRDGRREGPVGGCERGLRRPRRGAKMHPPQAS